MKTIIAIAITAWNYCYHMDYCFTSTFHLIYLISL